MPNAKMSTEILASRDQQFPFLRLPCELRSLIYRNLLCPEPDDIKILYHDRYGRRKSFNIHPSILRVNRQIYAESVSFLYDHNIFKIFLATRVVKQCTGGQYPDHIPEPQSLFRCHPTPHTRSQGLIYSDCLARMRHLEIEIAMTSVWGSTRWGYYLSHIGLLILKILESLAEQEVSYKREGPGMRTLEFSAHNGGGPLGTFFNTNWIEDIDISRELIPEKQGVMKMIYALLKAIEKVRKVHLKEIIYESPRLQISHVVDIEEL